MNLSKRAKKLTPSATLGMAAEAQRMRAEGIDVISFSTGEPDFDTPSYIKDAAKASLDRGCTKYAPPAGMPALREAIVRKLERDNGLAYTSQEISVTSGAKQAIANALLALVDPGDEVIVPAPYWVSYPPQVLLAGGEPVIVDTTKTGMKITPETLASAITGRTKALIFNSPSNPTGVVYSRDELAAIARVCVEKNVIVISDEIYEYLIYADEGHVSIVDADERMRPLTIIVNGVSKGYAMTGWRLGWAAGPQEVISKMSQLAGQQTTSPTSFVQEAAVVALDGPRDEVARMAGEFCARRDRMHALLRDIPGVSCHVPEGAFYHFPDMRAFMGKKCGGVEIDNDIALARALLTEAHVATVAGSSFGAPGFLRFSFAASTDMIDEGMRRVRKVLCEIH